MENKPLKRFAAGGVAATVWENQTEKDGKTISFETVSVERSYKDKDDKWQKTSNMRINDLPKVILVCNKAFEFLSLKKEE